MVAIRDITAVDEDGTVAIVFASLSSVCQCAIR